MSPQVLGGSEEFPSFCFVLELTLSVHGLELCSRSYCNGTGAGGPVHAIKPIRMDTKQQQV